MMGILKARSIRSALRSRWYSPGSEELRPRDAAHFKAKGNSKHNYRSPEETQERGGILLWRRVSRLVLRLTLKCRESMWLRSVSFCNTSLQVFDGQRGQVTPSHIAAPRGHHCTTHSARTGECPAAHDTCCTSEDSSRGSGRLRAAKGSLKYLRAKCSCNTLNTLLGGRGVQGVIHWHAQQGVAREGGMARHGTARHGTAGHSTALQAAAVDGYVRASHTAAVHVCLDTRHIRYTHYSHHALKSTSSNVVFGIAASLAVPYVRDSRYRGVGTLEKKRR
ncbi:hypothetical protein O3P69_006127 [Scylla paramamosain]|uniref:Uncharacterized protein n=1 Tax=Scylla paramamosain TaxID=85552 RepID=A0AAW0U8D9_SCYPA